mgnify:FL=1
MKIFVHPKSSEEFQARLANVFGAVRTMTEADIARIDMVVCGTWERRTHPEALRAACADCGRAIAHMPHAPIGPPKVCNACACLRVRAAHP